MTPHDREWTNPAQPSEVLPVSPYNLASVLVLGLFALSLAAAGLDISIRLEEEMNLDRESRGVDRIVGGLLCAVPDVGDAIERIETIRASMAKHLDELLSAHRAENLARLALVADAQMLAEEMRDVNRDWSVRKEEIEAGAQDLAPVYPTLGFRVVKDLPHDVA